MGDTNHAFEIVDRQEVSKILQDGKDKIEAILKQPEPEIQSIVDPLLKNNVGKNFTEFLLYIIKLFQNAVRNNTITMKNSVQESIMSELDHNYVVLMRVHEDFCSPEGQKRTDHSVAIVVGCATKVTDVIKSLQKKQWLRWFRPAKNISALVPIFVRITEVVRDVQCIECKTFSELLGDVAALQDSLIDIEKRLLIVQGTGLSASVLIGIGSIICMIVGGILLATPAGLPLLAVGGVGVGVSIATGGSTAFCSYMAAKRLDGAKDKGDKRANTFVKNDTTKLAK